MRLLYALVALMLIHSIYTFPLDSTLIGGTDTSSHLFKTWFVSENGLSYWSSDWYAGFPFISHYSPFFYLFSGFLGQLAGALTAYKISINLFFILLPLAFFSLVKELDLNESQKILGLALFSLSPIYIYYFFDGRHPSMIGFFFGVLFWKYLISFNKTKNPKSFLVSSFYLFFAILTHHLTAFLVMSSAIAYTLNKRGDFIGSLKISVLGFILSTPWSIPFLMGGLKRNAGRLISPEVEVEFASQVAQVSYIQDYAHSLSFVFIGSFGLILATFSALYLIELVKKKKIDGMVLSTAALMFLIFVISYNRAFMVLPIPVTILAIRGLKIQNKLILPIIGIVLLGAFHMSSVTFESPEVPHIPSGRALFLPISPFESYLYESFIVPSGGSSYALGWHPESQSIQKTKYNNMIIDPLSYTQNEYYDLLSEGAIKYVVVKSDLSNFFSESQNFELIEQKGEFYLFKTTPEPALSDINNNPIDIIEGRDSIYSTFQCSPGTITIKQSHNPSWKAWINGETVDIGSNEFGFMTIQNDVTGECKLEMRYFLI